MDDLEHRLALQDEEMHLLKNKISIQDQEINRLKMTVETVIAYLGRRGFPDILEAETAVARRVPGQKFGGAGIIGAFATRKMTKFGEEDIIGAVASRAMMATGKRVGEENFVGAVASTARTVTGKRFGEEDIVGALASRATAATGKRFEEEDLVGAVASSSTRGIDRKFRELDLVGAFPLREMAGPDMDQFEAYFKMADLDGNGRISGVEAVSFFLGSSLPKQVLAQIWMHADQSRNGFLGREEFFNALRLVTVAQSKGDLTPDIVKATLYGPAAAKIPAPEIELLATAAKTAAPLIDPIAFTSKEKINVTLRRDGEISNFKVQGRLSLLIPDEENALIQVQIETGGDPGIILETHPNLNGALLTNKKILGMEDNDTPFLSRGVVLKWKIESLDESVVPLTINCWPSVSGNESHVSVEYKASSMFDLRNVVISVPLPDIRETISIRQIDGEWRYDSRNSILEWSVLLIDNSNRSGSMKFVVPAIDSSSVFPISAQFSAIHTYGNIKVVNILPLNGGPPPKFSQITHLITSTYKVV